MPKFYPYLCELFELPEDHESCVTLPEFVTHEDKTYRRYGASYHQIGSNTTVRVLENVLRVTDLIRDYIPAELHYLVRVGLSHHDAQQLIRDCVDQQYQLEPDATNQMACQGIRIVIEAQK